MIFSVRRTLDLSLFLVVILSKIPYTCFLYKCAILIIFTFLENVLRYVNRKEIYY